MLPNTFCHSARGLLVEPIQDAEDLDSHHCLRRVSHGAAPVVRAARHSAAGSCGLDGRRRRRAARERRTVVADHSWLEATLAREAIWQGKWRYSGGVGGRPEPESCILYPPTLTEPLRLRIQGQPME